MIVPALLTPDPRRPTGEASGSAHALFPLARTLHETLCCGNRLHAIFATFSLRAPRRTYRYAFGPLQSEGRESDAHSVPSRRGT